jgi:hypothetical protein
VRLLKLGKKINDSDGLLFFEERGAFLGENIGAVFRKTGFFQGILSFLRQESAERGTLPFYSIICFNFTLIIISSGMMDFLRVH